MEENLTHLRKSLAALLCCQLFSDCDRQMHQTINHPKRIKITCSRRVRLSRSLIRLRMIVFLSIELETRLGDDSTAIATLYDIEKQIVAWRIAHYSAS